MKSPSRILIADDHPLFCRGLREVICQGILCELVEAADGTTALALISTRQPDLAILDINMPGLDGLEVVRQMQQRRLSSEVIFLTMHKEPDLFDAAMDLNVKGYILKDSAVTEILDCIRSVQAGRRYISPALSDVLLSRRAAAQQLHQAKPGLDQLTPAERRVLKLIAQDHTSKEIADSLGVSPRTIENHRTNICGKLGVHGIHSLVKFAYDNRSRL